jgi:hypothetical protein
MQCIKEFIPTEALFSTILRQKIKTPKKLEKHLTTPENTANFSVY